MTITAKSMNVSNNIRRFIFYDNSCDRRSNYPGLIDAIYIVFFLDKANSANKSDEILVALRSKDKLNSDGAHGAQDDPEYDEPNWDPEKDGDCAHLVLPCIDEAFNNLDCGFLRVPIDADKSSFSCKSQGPAKGITYLSELNVVLKERSYQVSELQHALLHSGPKIGVFFRDANGDTRLMADPDYDMNIEIADESGEGPTGSASASIKFSQVSKLPPVYYRGSMRFSESYLSDTFYGMQGLTLNCETGITQVEGYKNKK